MRRRKSVLAEEQRKLMAKELLHCVKKTLTVVQATLGRISGTALSRTLFLPKRRRLGRSP